MEPAATFYFDLASPEAYLAAERALAVAPAPCEWQPILASRLPHAETFIAYRCRDEELIAREDVERRARDYGLLPVVWPDPFPFDSTFAMQVATYAKRIGRAVAFAQAAFRQAFAAGRALADRDSVLIAAAACEMHPKAVLAAAATRTVAAELERATLAALELGVSDVPAVRVGDTVLVGEARLGDAAELLEARRG